MSSDDLTPRRDSRQQPQQADETDSRVEALTELVGKLSGKVTKLTERLDAFGDPPASGDDTDDSTDEKKKDKDKPAPWVVYTPPAAAEDQKHRAEKHTPRFTLENFVAWYNTVYVGAEGTSARPIPACWRKHPGLAAEVATLAYAWRQANIGSTANARDAQQWHHQHRPGFAARMASEWTHQRCLDGNHQAVGAPTRDDRYGTPDTSGDPQSQ